MWIAVLLIGNEISVKFSVENWPWPDFSTTDSVLQHFPVLVPISPFCIFICIWIIAAVYWRQEHQLELLGYSWNLQDSNMQCGHWTLSPMRLGYSYFPNRCLSCIETSVTTGQMAIIGVTDCPWDVRSLTLMLIGSVLIFTLLYLHMCWFN